MHQAALAILMWAMCFSAAIAQTQTQLLLVLSDGGGASNEVVAAMRSHFSTQSVDLGIRTVDAAVLSQRRIESDIDIIVAIGTYAMEQVALNARVIEGRAPVFNILVPRQSYETTRLRARLEARQFSALYLDQPLSRQLQLIKTAFPGRDSVGVLLGATSQDRLKPLQQAAREQNLNIISEPVAAEEDILRALKRLMSSADVLLAIPDPLVFNRNTAQSLLLTSYRAQIPLIAYSKSYVNAGALAAVHSSPAQIGQHAAELLARALAAKPLVLPSVQYPKYFSVSVNYQVARSLGLTIEDEATLQKQIKAGTERD